MNEYNVCGVMVLSTPEKVHNVSVTLADMEGVEVHAATDEGRIVVTVEAEHSKNCADTFSSFNHIQGVVSTALVYHEIDSEPSLQESAK